MVYSFKDIKSLQGLLALNVCDTQNFLILGFSSQSQEVKEGYIFVSLSEKANDYIGDAVKNGASVVISSLLQCDCFCNNNVLFLHHFSPKEIYNKIAAEFYSCQPQNICAVTGTNGKTSTVNFVQQLWTLTGRKSISIGTLGTKSNIDVLNEETVLTTPDSKDLHRILNDAKNLGVDYAAIEASSHGIDQKRMHSVHLKAAGFTNLSLDHLDYHKTLGEYLKAKIKLFNEILPEDGYAILNCDIREYSEILSSICTQNIITYGKNAVHLQLLAQDGNANGQDLLLNVFGKQYKIYFPILGKFQAYNLLCAIGLLLCHDKTIKFEDLLFDKMHSVPGRLEVMQKNDAGITVVIDYAHTPEGLREAILSLKWHFNKKINVVFGCGGDRDSSKRAIMGSIASDLANMVLVCDDNPRMEDPSVIRKEILAGCKGKNAVEVGNRAEAIKYAIQKSRGEEVILVAGKGAEQYQIIGDMKVPYSDFAVINDALSAH